MTGRRVWFLRTPGPCSDREFACGHDCPLVTSLPNIDSAKSIIFVTAAAQRILPLCFQIPCTPQIVGCPKPPAPIATLNPPSNVWHYQRVGGYISYPASAMPFTNIPNNPWQSLLTATGDQLCNAAAFAAAYGIGHVCSYQCMTSPYVATSENDCWINAQQAPAEGATLCPAATVA